MRKVMMIAAVAAMAAAVPAIADGQGRGHGKGHAKGQQTHPAACPPGLANRGCMPPGHARRMFREGQRVPRTFRGFTAYDAIPEVYRDRYDIPIGQQYIYRDNALYVVDPTTSLVRSIIDLID